MWSFSGAGLHISQVPGKIVLRQCIELRSTGAQILTRTWFKEMLSFYLYFSLTSLLSTASSVGKRTAPTSCRKFTSDFRLKIIVLNVFF
jgi:hypothetical protein